jgi:hypothetical protein
LRLDGFAGHRYAIDAANAVSLVWNEVGLATNVTGVVHWTDPSPYSNHRLYRARVLNP